MIPIHQRLLVALQTEDPLSTIKSLERVAKLESGLSNHEYWDAVMGWLACYINQEQPGNKKLIDLFGHVYKIHVAHGGGGDRGSLNN